MTIDLSDIADEVYFSWLLRVGLDADLVRFEMYAAELRGDDPQVSAVVSRVANILKPGSRLLATWEVIKGVVAHLVNSRAALEQIVWAMQLAHAFATALAGNRASRNYREARDPFRVWKDALDILERTVDDCGVSSVVPTNLEEIMEPKQIFNATRYWLDWSRSGRGDNF